MYNEEGGILNLNGDALWQMLGPFLIVIAENDIKRSQRGKLIEKLLVVDVAAVDDGVTAGDDLNDFRAEGSCVSDRTATLVKGIPPIRDHRSDLLRYTKVVRKPESL